MSRSKEYIQVAGQRTFRLHIHITIIITLSLLRGVIHVGSNLTVTTPAGLFGDPTTGQHERYTIPTTTVKKRRRTTPPRMSFAEDCDYLAYYCMKAYKTGVICGRTIFYKYANFMTYCQMDYVNCMERYEVWQLAHMGECYNVPPLTDYIHYEYKDDYFLDRDFVSDD